MLNFVKNMFKPIVNKTTPVVNNKPIQYVLNDPTTPTLILEMLPPAPPEGMAFVVNGYKGGGYKLGTPQGQAANNYATIANSIKQNQVYCGKTFRNWAATARLNVFPRAGKDLNAYYDRKNLKFFYVPNPLLKKMVFAADSADIVAHELGHAILDTVRPDLYGVQCLEVWAFHEAFADINSVLAMLSYKPVLEYILNETGNDLRKDNTVTRLAEEFSIVIYDLLKEGKRGAGLRNAINNFVYTQPEKLPADGSDNILTKNPHNFGRIFLGAWYEILVCIYELECKKASPIAALEKARDAAGTYLWGGILQAPVTMRFFEAVANGMVSFTKMKIGGEHLAIVERVLQKRKILFPRISILSNIELKDLKLKSAEVIRGKNRKFIVSNEIKKVKLIEHLGIMAQSDNPLLNLEIEVPNGFCYEFDGNGILMAQSSDTWEEAVNAARACLVYLHQKKLVDGIYEKNNNNNVFEAVDGKLIRKKFI
jgi:hypothetical protein